MGILVLLLGLCGGITQPEPYIPHTSSVFRPLDPFDGRYPAYYFHWQTPFASTHGIIWFTHWYKDRTTGKLVPQHIPLYNRDGFYWQPTLAYGRVVVIKARRVGSRSEIEHLQTTTGRKIPPDSLKLLQLRRLQEPQLQVFP